MAAVGRLLPRGALIFTASPENNMHRLSSRMHPLSVIIYIERLLYIRKKKTRHISYSRFLSLDCFFIRFVSLVTFPHFPA